MTEQTPPNSISASGADLLNGSITVTSDTVQALQIAPPPTISALGDHGLLWAIHPDGRVELGDGYTPDEAAASFWEAVKRLAPDPMVQQYGAPLTARINTKLAAGEQAQKTLAALAPMFEGLDRLITTSSRDWGEYRVDAWLYAVLVGWDCEQTEHDDTCSHGALEEMQQRHGWSDEAVAKARRYRAAVRTVTAQDLDSGE